MRLKDGFVTQTVDDTQFLVPLGSSAFSGIVRSNETAAFIVNQLQRDVTEAEIADAMARQYDAPRETIAADVSEIIGKLRAIGALEE